ncbi:MAG: acyl-CoA dehydrogenase family protein [Anaerolineae bacterium]|nr:acyl-CoA dehydrogenase family protein [Anaerolineae bacterium]
MTPDLARHHLNEWQKSQPSNFFTADLGLQRTLELLWGTADYKQNAARLYRFGGTVATALDAAAAELSLHPPIWQLYDPAGRPINQVHYHPNQRLIGQALAAAGLSGLAGEKGQNLLAAALYYLAAHIGEAGQIGPVAWTAGMIKLLRDAATPSLRDQFLPDLLDPQREPPLTGANFFSEVQSGSDLGRNSSFAYRDEGDNWYINGEKSFCANITADLILVTAQVVGQGDGRDGLGLFLVPRAGQPDRLVIRRPQPLYGSPALAVGELLFQDALAYPIGPVTDGYTLVTTHVWPNAQRHNALACAAAARRAYLIAWQFAEHRQAQDVPLIHYPLVQESLTQMRSDAAALLSGTLRLLHWLDELEIGEHRPDTPALIRLGTLLSQLRAPALAHEVIQQGMELLGGYGMLTDLSILPRLWQDHLVYARWAGTPNVIVQAIQQEMRQNQGHEPFIALIRAMLQPSPFDDLRREALAQLAQLEQVLTDLLLMDEMSASVPLRPLLARLMDLYYTACLAIEGAWEYLRKDDRSKHRLAHYFFNRRVLGREAKDIADYAHQISKLCKDIRPSRIDWQKDEELQQKWREAGLGDEEQ